MVAFVVILLVGHSYTSVFIFLLGLVKNAGNEYRGTRLAMNNVKARRDRRALIMGLLSVAPSSMLFASSSAFSSGSQSELEASMARIGQRAMARLSTQRLTQLLERYQYLILAGMTSPDAIQERVSNDFLMDNTVTLDGALLSQTELAAFIVQSSASAAGAKL